MSHRWIPATLATLLVVTALPTASAEAAWQKRYAYTQADQAAAAAWRKRAAAAAWKKRQAAKVRDSAVAAPPAPPAAPARASRTLASGVTHTFIRRQTAAGPMVINVLKVNPRQVTIKSIMASKPGGGFGRAKVSSIARAFGALAAINGSFFSMKSNEPASLLVLDGQIVSSSPFNRSVFGVRYDGTPFIDDARIRAAVLLDDGRELPISRVNHLAKPNELTLYTAHYGPSSRTGISVNRYEAAINADGVVIEVSNGNLPIPRGGYVISGNGDGYRTLVGALRPGSRALVYTQLPAEWEGVRYAVGGGPTILRNGRVHVTAQAEGFDSHVASGRAPRTAIGYTEAGQALMVTVDGRQPKHSVGCTLQELARLMADMGAIEAINLDGGGSSTMVIHGKPVNKVSGGAERLVSNAIGIFPSE